MPEICAIAVPVYGEGKNIIASISIAYPTINKELENMETMINHTKKTAEIISIIMKKERINDLPAKLITNTQSFKL